MQLRIDDDFERSISFSITPVPSPDNPESYTAIRKKLESFGVKCPTKSWLSSLIQEKFNINYDDKLFPATAEEEAEQVNMATRLSSLIFDKTASTCTATKQKDEIYQICDSDEGNEDKEAANILLSLHK